MTIWRNSGLAMRVRTGFGSSTGAVRLVCWVAVLVAMGAGAGSAGERERAIPAGQEELLAEMLGRGVALPGNCRFAGGQVQAAIVVAEYTCGSETIVLELRDPGDAPSSALRTQRFAIVVRSGAADPDLLATLGARIRAREESVQWKEASVLRRQVGGREFGAQVLVGSALGIMAIGLVVQCFSVWRWGRLRGGPVVASRARWSRASACVVAALIAVFLAIRLSFVTVMPVFIDESVHIEWARSFAGNFVAEFSVGRWLPVRIMALLVALPLEPLVGARVASVSMSLAALVGCIFVNRALFSAAEGVLAGVVYATLPYVLWYDRLALADIYLVAFGTWALYFSLAARGGGGIAVILAMNLCLYAAILSKPTGGLFLVFPILVAGVLLRGEERRVYWARVWPAAGGGLALLAFLLWAGYGTGLLVSQLALEAGGQWVGLFLKNLLLLSDWLVVMMTPPVGGALAAATVVASIAMLRGARREGFLVLLLASSVIPYALVSRTWYPSYLLFVAVPVSLLLGRGIAVAAVAVSGLVDGKRPSLAEPLERVTRVVLAAALVCVTLPRNVVLLADPQEAVLPAIERARFVTGGLSGYGLPELAAFLRREATLDPVHVVRFDMAQPPREGLNVYLRASDRLRLHVIDPGDERAAARLSELVRSGRTLFVSNPEVEAARGAPAPPDLGDVVRIWSYERPGGQSRLEVWEVRPAGGTR